MTSGWRADGAAVGLGVLSALALPPLHILPALLLAFPGLLLLIGAAPGPFVAARRGFWFGMGHHVIGLYWITEAILLEAARYWWLVPLAVPALSAVLALFIAAPCGLARLVPAGWRRVVGLAGLWTLFDLARQFIGTGFPWNPFGSVWAIPGLAGDIMLQPAAWIGTPGLTFITILLAGAVILGRAAMLGGAVVLAGWASAGLLRLQAPEPPGTGLTAILIQGNVQQAGKWSLVLAREAFERQLALTRQAVMAAAGPSIVIWPETSSTPYWLETDPGARAAILAASAPPHAIPARAALVGSLSFSQGEPSDDPNNLPLNSLVAMGADGRLAPLYSKWHLVPFGEYPPSWVPFAIQIVPGRFGFGHGPATLRLPGVPPFGPMICYEAIFPAQVVDQADRPDWLVNITNDAWFGNSTGPRQHLAAVRMRAVEEGLPVMRAANTGITAGFDARGRELGRTAMGVATTLSLSLPGRRPATSFSRWGLVIPGILAAVATAAAFAGTRPRLLPQRL